MSTKTQTQTITVVAFRVGAAPEVMDMPDTLEAKQAFVGGYIEMPHLCMSADGKAELDVVCNEEGKLDGLAPNRAYGDDVLCGDFLVSRANPNTGESESLTPEDIALAIRYFTGRELF